MAQSNRVREPLQGPLSIDTVQQRLSAGWRLVALEWEKPAEGEVAPAMLEQPPFGRQVATDCRHLEPNPQEEEILQRILDLIIDDRSLAEIASDLNERRLPNRAGLPWRQLDVFNLWPRLIDAAPELRPVAR